MEQGSINQRLKFLAENLAESARAFSDALDESPTNTHNYISGGRKPAPEYLRKILLQYRNVNAHWLLTGEGEPFTSEVAESRVEYQSQAQNQKKNRGHIINHTGSGPATYTLEACQHERDLLQLTCDQQRDKIELLQANVEDLRKALASLSKP